MTAAGEPRTEIETLERLLESLGVTRSERARVVPLSGGITNRNYRVDAGDEVYVVRIGGENAALLGIDRAREHVCSVTAADLGISPEVVAFVPEADALVTR